MDERSFLEETQRQVASGRRVDALVAVYFEGGGVRIDTATWFGDGDRTGWCMRSHRVTTEPALDKLERQYLEQALRANGGRIGETAEVAGISPRTLLRKLKQHGIDKREFRASAKRAR